jgi:hypothetical protein
VSTLFEDRIARQEILTDDITTSAAEQDGEKFHALIVELNELWQEKEHRSLDTGQSRRQPNSRSPQLDGCSTGRQRREARTQETTPVRTGASRCSGVLLPGTNHPIIRMGIVGTEEPLFGSTVIAKALASTPVGSGGLITVALPCASGLKIPAGIGAPLIGISYSSYTFCGGNAWKLLASKIRLGRSRT